MGPLDFVNGNKVNKYTKHHEHNLSMDRLGPGYVSKSLATKSNIIPPDT